MDLHNDRIYWTKDDGPFTFDEYVEQTRPREGESEQDAWNRVHRVAETLVGNCRVSTVALMMDIGFHPYTGVQRFETMVFVWPDQPGGALDEHTRRYATLAQAIHGHDQIVAKLRDRHPFTVG